MQLHFKGIHIVSKILTRFFSGGRGIAVTIFPFVFYSNKYVKVKQIIQTHETIHIQQQLECGLAGVFLFIIGVVFIDQVLVFLPAVFLYYILYLIMYIVNRIKYRNSFEAYKNIPFEKEAFKNENQVEYPIFRKTFAWLKEL